MLLSSYETLSLESSISFYLNISSGFVSAYRLRSSSLIFLSSSNGVEKFLEFGFGLYSSKMIYEDFCLVYLGIAASIII